MPFVLAVVVDAAALRGEGADEVRVGDVCCLEVLPEEGAPAALLLVSCISCCDLSVVPGCRVDL